jgi:hypothetical protein
MCRRFMAPMLQAPTLTHYTKELLKNQYKTSPSAPENAVIKGLLSIPASKTFLTSAGAFL